MAVVILKASCSWDLKVKDPYTTMAEGLAAIPSLEELHITFNHWTVNSMFPFDKFSNLRVLDVAETQSVRQHPFSTIVNIRRAIQASPRLTQLRVMVPTVGQMPTLDDLIAPPVEIRLERMRMLDSACFAFSMCLDALFSLTSVNIPNHNEACTASFWAALAHTHVQLLCVSVQELTCGLLKYLESYSGLQSMRIKGGASSSDARKFLSRFFTDVVPKHRLSLSTISAEVLPCRDFFQAVHPYALGREHVEAIAQCPMLSRLSAVIHQPWSYRQSFECAVVRVVRA